MRNVRSERASSEMWKVYFYFGLCFLDFHNLMLYIIIHLSVKVSDHSESVLFGEHISVAYSLSLASVFFVDRLQV